MAPLIRRKWNESRGATMIIALLYVVVALAIGAMVLTAAYVNLGHIKRNETDQQDAQAVTSAVRVVRKLLGEKTCTVTYVESQVTTYHPAEIDAEGNVIKPGWTQTSGPFYSKTTSNPNLGGTDYNGRAELLPLNLVEDIVYRSSGHFGSMEIAPDYKVNLSMQLNAKENGAYLMPETKGTLKVLNKQEPDLGLEQFSLVLTLYVQRDGENRYTTTVTIPAAVRTTRQQAASVSSGNTTTTYWTHTTEIRWQVPTTIKGVLQ